MRPIYVDYNATTPVAPEVADAMLPYLHEHFGNPSSTHVYGRSARDAVAQARAEVAALIGAAQRVEHYEIAAYRTARAFARELGFADIARSLDLTLQEEGDTDKELSGLAEGSLFRSGINDGARQ